MKAFLNVHLGVYQHMKQKEALYYRTVSFNTLSRWNVQACLIWKIWLFPWAEVAGSIRKGTKGDHCIECTFYTSMKESLKTWKTMWIVLPEPHCVSLRHSLRKARIGSRRPWNLPWSLGHVLTSIILNDFLLNDCAWCAKGCAAPRSQQSWLFRFRWPLHGDNYFFFWLYRTYTVLTTTKLPAYSAGKSFKCPFHVSSSSINYATKSYLLDMRSCAWLSRFSQLLVTFRASRSPEMHP